jgi:hypothetical protein
MPKSVPAHTVNKVCGSGLKAAMLAAQAIKAGDAAGEPKAVDTDEYPTARRLRMSIERSRLPARGTEDVVDRQRQRPACGQG